VTSYVSVNCSLWITFSTCYQISNQLMLDVNSWNFVKRMTKQSHYSCKEPMVEIMSTLNVFHYYKIENGTIVLVLLNNVVIVFTMDVMHI
jgi:hypothetical protein